MIKIKQKVGKKITSFYDLEAKRIVMFQDYSMQQKIFEKQRLLLLKIKVKQYAKNKDAKILDVGCGDGHFLYFLEESGLRNLYGFDISKIRVERAKKLTGFKQRITVSRAEKTKYPDKHFDIVFSSEVIEHIEKPDLLLKEANRVLKESGYLIIATPNDEKIKMQRCIHCNKLTPGSAHLHSFTVNSLEKDLKRRGFQCIEFFYILNNIKPLSILNKVVDMLPPNIFSYMNLLITKRRGKRNWLVMVAQKNKFIK